MWEGSLPKGRFLCFLPFLVKTKKNAKADPGSKFQAGIYGDIFIEFCNLNVEKMTWKMYIFCKMYPQQPVWEHPLLNFSNTMKFN